jgi:DNA-binding GntR family transcriptional regulator
VQIEVAKNRSTDVYESMRVAIVSGALRPNEPLIEDDLAKSYLVSRTPIRESFQRLYRDGLIVPRKRGWAVREFTRAEVLENYEVRAGLHALAARLAAERGSPAQKTAIQKIHHERLSLNTKSVVERVRTNREFHDAVVAAAQNSRLTSVIFSTGNFYFNQRAASQTSQESFEKAQLEHEEITAAIMRGDGNAADAAMRSHILRAMHVWSATVDPH